MNKPELKSEFQENPEAFKVFLMILGMENDCTPCFLDQDEADAKAGKTFPESVAWPAETEVDNAAADALTIIPTQSSAAKKIREKYSKLMKAVAAPYSAEERETWPYQRRAAEAYAADQTILPFIQNMADARGITVVDLLTLIQENIDLYDQKIFVLLGHQQKELEALS